MSTTLERPSLAPLRREATSIRHEAWRDSRYQAFVLMLSLVVVSGSYPEWVRQYTPVRVMSTFVVRRGRVS